MWGAVCAEVFAGGGLGCGGRRAEGPGSRPGVRTEGQGPGGSAPGPGGGHSGGFIPSGCAGKAVLWPQVRGWSPGSLHRHRTQKPAPPHQSWRLVKQQQLLTLPAAEGRTAWWSPRLGHRGFREVPRQEAGVWEERGQVGSFPQEKENPTSQTRSRSLGPQKCPGTAGFGFRRACPGGCLSERP